MTIIDKIKHQKSWFHYLILILLSLWLYLPGITTLPVIDRDEARFAQATKQMLETNDFITIRFQDSARNKKPVGIYWLQAASVQLFGNLQKNELWTYRLPSLLAAIVAILATYGIGSFLFGKQAAFLGAILLATSLNVVIEAHQAKTDAALLACTTITQLILGKIFLSSRRSLTLGQNWIWFFWITIGLGVLIKGPILPLLTLLTLASLSFAESDFEWLKLFRPGLGFMILGLITLPWFVAIFIQTNGAFFYDSLYEDFFKKFVSGVESHGAPPLTYFFLLPITFWPAGIFLGLTIAWAWKNRSSLEEKFLLFWTVPFWITLELVPTKLPHYLLPVFPALSLMTARALTSTARGISFSWPWLERFFTFYWFLITFSSGAILMIAPIYFGEGFLISGFLLFAIAISFCMIIYTQSSTQKKIILAILTSLLMLPIAFEATLPQLSQLWIAQRVEKLLKNSKHPITQPLATTFHEPSIVFALGTQTKLVDVNKAVDYLTNKQGSFALIENSLDDLFKKTVLENGWEPKEEGRISGINYSKGRAITLILYTAESL